MTISEAVAIPELPPEQNEAIEKRRRDAEWVARHRGAIPIDIRRMAGREWTRPAAAPSGNRAYQPGSRRGEHLAGEKWLHRHDSGWAPVAPEGVDVAPPKTPDETEERRAYRRRRGDHDLPGSWPTCPICGGPLSAALRRGARYRRCVWLVWADEPKTPTVDAVYPCILCAGAESMRTCPKCGDPIPGTARRDKFRCTRCRNKEKQAAYRERQQAAAVTT